MIVFLLKSKEHFILDLINIELIIQEMLWKMVIIHLILKQ